MAIPRNLANIAPHMNASSTELVVNDGGANLDFRVEGDTNANLFFIDASTDRIGVGTSTPVSLLELKAGLPILTFTDDNDSSATRLYEDSGLFAIDVDPTDTKPLSYLQLKIDGVEKARLNSNALLVGTTSTTANGGVLQVSNGITFPATQVPCSDVNTLDDYEEGTWTPSLVGATSAGTTTYSGRSGLYTKIGNRVWVQFDANVTNMTGTGNLIINNLPFTSASGTAQSSPVMSTNLPYPTTTTQLNLYVGSGSTTATFFSNGNNLAWANVQVDTSYEVNGTLTYQV